jgi:hypothetical protein
MTDSVCSICESKVSPLECWCVIDTHTHTRKYECKKPCVRPRPPPPPPPPVEVFEIEIEEQPPSAPPVEDWVEAYARPSLFRRIVGFFTTEPVYTKVKTS